MATRKAKPAAAASAPRKLERDYVVVRCDGDKLTVVDPQRSAKNQVDAMDAVSANLPPAERNVSLGAFLLSSYREKQYTTKQQFVTTSSERQASFVTPVADGVAGSGD